MSDSRLWKKRLWYFPIKYHPIGLITGVDSSVIEDYLQDQCDFISRRMTSYQSHEQEQTNPKRGLYMRLYMGLLWEL